MNLREQIVDFLNRHPSSIGVWFAVMGAWEGWNAVFRYDAYRVSIENRLRRRPWLIVFGVRIPSERPIQISGAVFWLILGLVMIDAELGLLPRKFWLCPLILALLAFFLVLSVVKLKSWGNRHSS